MELLPTRVPESLAQTLEEIVDAIIEESAHQIAEDGGFDPEPPPYDAERKFIEHTVNKVIELINAKSRWISREGPIDRDLWPTEPRNPPPAWFLDYHRELTEVVLSRQWIAQLENMVARLIDINTRSEER